MLRNGRNAVDHRRRGTVLVFTAVMLVVLCGFAAMTLDVGYMYNVRADLQRTADAAALAAAARLAEHDASDPVARAREAAVEYVKKNPSLGADLTIEDNDVTFGLANYDADTNTFNFEETEILPDAVRVRVRRTQGSPNGPVSLWFARVFGIKTTDISAQATAVMTPRDIALTVDLSGSINDDSELKSYKLTDINLFEVWNALPGGSDDVSACDNITCGAGDACVGGVCVPVGPGAQSGPTWGFFDRLGFGTPDLSSSYDPTTDPGLIRLPYNSNWTDAQLSTYLTDRGYTADEITGILSSAGDTSSGVYPARVAVALGLADWKSGRAGGLWSRVTLVASAVDNDTRVESNELEWKENVFDHSLSTSGTIWTHYIDNYMRGTNSGMYQANNNFRYRFGVKTFINYLLEIRDSNAETPELAGAPAQPMQAVKDAGGYMVNMLNELEANDQLSLEVYATTGRHEMNLTTDFAGVAKRLTEVQAGHYDSSTNIGGGLLRAITELTSSRARTVSRKVIVLLTDGVANVDENGNSGSAGGGAYALALAQKAADLGIKIFAVSVGAGADQNLMQQIATIGNGEHFHAEGSIDEYSNGLADIFSTIGVRRSVTLIE